MNPLSRVIQAAVTRGSDGLGKTLATQAPQAGVGFQRDALALASRTFKPSGQVVDQAVASAASHARALAAVHAVRGKVLSGKKMIKLLELNGFLEERVKGSHHIMVKGAISVPVPVHGNEDLGKGLVSAILREAGLK